MTKPKALNPWQPITDKKQLAIVGKLLEELGEATKAAARCVIQGLDGADPVTLKNNTDALLEELADVYACSSMFFKYTEANDDAIASRIQSKIEHLTAWHKLLT